MIFGRYLSPFPGCILGLASRKLTDNIFFMINPYDWKSSADLFGKNNCGPFDIKVSNRCKIIPNPGAGLFSNHTHASWWGQKGIETCGWTGIKITDDMMCEIVRKMADEYWKKLAWSSLPIVAETVFEPGNRWTTFRSISLTAWSNVRSVIRYNLMNRWRGIRYKNRE